MRKDFKILRCLVFMLIIIACQNEKMHFSTPKFKSMQVKASAYNSVSFQTDGNPSKTAWGDRLTDSTKAIAISRDLLDSGLVHNQRVYIPELNEYYRVLDKMHYKWRKKVDVFMGRNVKAARKFGRQEVTIVWIVGDTLAE